MAVIIRYRFEVLKPFTCPARWRHFFSRTEVPKGVYHYTMAYGQYDHERAINEMVRLSDGSITARIESTHPEGL